MAKNSNQTKAVASPDDLLGSAPKTVSASGDNGASTADLAKSAVAALADVPEEMLPPAPGELSDAGGKGEPLPNSNVTENDSDQSGNPAVTTVKVAAGTTIVNQGVGPGRYVVTCQPATPIAHHQIEVDADHAEDAWGEWLKVNGVSSTIADRQITRLGDKTGTPIVKAETVKPTFKQPAVEFSEIVDGR